MWIKLDWNLPDYVNIKQCWFLFNSVWGDGGAIYAQASEFSALPLVIEDTFFKSNIATNKGGAVYFSESPTFSKYAEPRKATIKDCDFDVNVADSEGLATNFGTPTNLVIQNIAFWEQGPCKFLLFSGRNWIRRQLKL